MILIMNVIEQLNQTHVDNNSQLITRATKYANQLEGPTDDSHSVREHSGSRRRMKIIYFRFDALASFLIFMLH